jgi:Tfp pilus assembly protein PilO
VREEWGRKAQTDLTALEKGLIAAESLPQAQAQLLQIVRRVARSESPALDLKGTDFGQTRAYGEHYAEVLLTVSLECQIEQLVNFLADIAAQPELLALDELHVAAGNSKTKTVMVRITVSGLVRSGLMRPAGARS